MPQYLIYAQRKCGSTARGNGIWTKSELIAELQKRSLPTTGTITELCQRLIDYQSHERIQKKQTVEPRIIQKKQAVETHIPQKKQIVEPHTPQKKQIVEPRIPQKKQIIEPRMQNESQVLPTCQKHIVKPMSRLEIMLNNAVTNNESDRVVQLLKLSSQIYYHGIPQEYEGQVYTEQDLPSDEVYDTFRNQYLPIQDPSEELPIAPEALKGLVKIKHPFPMGSLRKYRASNMSDLRGLFTIKDEPLLIQGKVDGMSLRCWFINGKIDLALTRYDHEQGILRLDKATMFVKKPKLKGKIVIRGEVIVRGDDYQHIVHGTSDGGKKGFASRLSAAVGLMNQIEYTGVKEYLHWIPYEITEYLPTNQDINAGYPAILPATQMEHLELLEKLGYEVPQHRLISYNDLTNQKLQEILVQWRQQIDYSIDGLVICPNQYQLEMVDTPRYKVAYKGFNVGQWTTVTVITPRATRTGLVIPQVYIKPVCVNGSNITTIAGANYNMIVEKGITINGEVYVVKANEVIPFIENVRQNPLVKTQPVTIPTVCPACGQPLVVRLRQLRCMNALCPAKTLGDVEHFISNIGVVGFGKKTLEKFGTIEQLYQYTIDELTQIEGIGRKKAQSLYQQLRDKINPILDVDLLSAIGTSLIGKNIAQLILSTMTIEQLFGSQPPSIEQLSHIHGIGKERSQSIIGRYQYGHQLIEFLKKYGLKIKRYTQLLEKTSADKYVICLTGTGNHTRAEYQTMIRSHGWEFTNSITSSVNLLVSSGLDSTKSKDAKRRGIKIISYDELDDLLSH